MRDVKVAFDKIGRALGFKTAIGVEEGIREMVGLLRSGFLRESGVVLKNAGTND
jgi:hypothetical protein